MFLFLEGLGEYSNYWKYHGMKLRNNGEGECKRFMLLAR